MNPLLEALTQRLETRVAQQLYRQRRVTDSPQQPLLKQDGRELLAFSSNDYLGLANHPRVIEAFTAAVRQYGVGSGASHLINGHLRPHHQLEEALADFTGRERAVLFSTGYQANLGTLSGLLGHHDRIYQDRLNHASLIDGATLSRARLLRYRHADSGHLAELLSRRPPATTALIATDGVFSMDGDVAPLKGLAALCQRRGAWLMVDDAHGLGVLGPGGAGSLAGANLDERQVPVLMGTLGKAFGTHGAFVAGSQGLIDFLLQTARSYIYTTALPPALAVATSTALAIAREESWRRDVLAERVAQFRAGAAELGYRLLPTSSPIQPLLVGESGVAVALSEALEARGLLVTAIRPPTVPAGTARLRVTLSAAHDGDQVARLLQGLAAVRSLLPDLPGSSQRGRDID